MQVEISGIKLGYGIDGDGPPLVLLHAFPLSRQMWRPQVGALRDRFTVITPDMQGFGESEVPRGPLTLDDCARDVLGVLDALGHQRVALGGCSIGGYIAFRIMARAADRVSALILADTRADPDSEEGRQRRQAAIARIEKEGPEGFLADLLQQLVGPTTKADRPGVMSTARQIIGSPDPRSLTAALSALATRPDSRPLLGSIKVPTLIVVGEEDALTPPEASEAMAAAIPDARLVRIPGAGHLSNLEAPEAFNRAVREFLVEP